MRGMLEKREKEGGKIGRLEGLQTTYPWNLGSFMM